MSISFRNLEDSKDDYIKLYNWCKNKYVYEWFEQRIFSYDEIVSKYKNKINNNEQDLYIIKYDDKDIGLVQIYTFNNDIDLDIKTNAYEYDLFIGEEDYLNKGIGANIVEKVNDMIYDKYKGDYIVLRPFKRNIRAVKCYEKCGFELIKEYEGKDTLGNLEKISVLVKEN